MAPRFSALPMAAAAVRTAATAKAAAAAAAVTGLTGAARVAGRPRCQRWATLRARPTAARSRQSERGNGDGTLDDQLSWGTSWLGGVRSV